MTDGVDRRSAARDRHERFQPRRLVAAKPTGANVGPSTSLREDGVRSGPSADDGVRFRLETIATEPTLVRVRETRPLDEGSSPGKSYPLADRPGDVAEESKVFRVRVSAAVARAWIGVAVVGAAGARRLGRGCRLVPGPRAGIRKGYAGNDAGVREAGAEVVVFLSPSPIRVAVAIDGEELFPREEPGAAAEGGVDVLGMDAGGGEVDGDVGEGGVGESRVKGEEVDVVEGEDVAAVDETRGGDADVEEPTAVEAVLVALLDDPHAMASRAGDAGEPAGEVGGETLGLGARDALARAVRRDHAQEGRGGVPGRRGGGEASGGSELDGGEASGGAKVVAPAAQKRDKRGRKDKRGERAR